MPTSTDSRIEELCNRIRHVCAEPFTARGEQELRKLAHELRIAIGEHLTMAKSSLGTKQSAILVRDPAEK